MRRRASAACAAALVAACALAVADRAQAGPAHPLLAAGEATHYLYPLGAAQREDEILIGMAMLSMLAHKQDAEGKCLSDACVHDRSDIYGEMALAYSRLGLHGLALRLYRAAGQDLPDDADAHYNIGVELESTQQTDAAAKELAKAAELSAGKDKKAEEGIARFYFLAGKLDLARAHFEHCQLADGDPDLAQYCALGLLLTTVRGADNLVPPPPAGAPWPGPLLSYQRNGNEAALAAAIAHTDDATKRRQHLCEALYYAGERELQAGRRELALRFFRAGVAQRVESFWEHFAALRRIEQMHGNDDPPPPPPPPASHLPIG